MEVRNLQKQTGLLIPRLPFSRLVRELTMSISGKSDLRFQASAIAALQHSAEMVLVMWFEMLYLPYEIYLNNSVHASLHGRRKTIMPKDSRLIQNIFSIWDPLCFLARPPTTYIDMSRAYRLPPTQTKKSKKQVVPRNRSGQTAKKSTGGEDHDVRDKLVAKAARVPQAAS